MIQWMEAEGKTIQNAPLTGPTKRRFPIYLPPDYDSQRKEPYPVIFVLSGWGGKSQKYLLGNEDSAFGTPTYARLDQMISKQEMPGVIVVAPDGTTALGCSQYINSPANGNFMDYISDELVELIDSQFHTHRSETHRGIMGHSSGGFGALVIAMKRSDRFRAVMSSAGDTYFELSILPQMTPTIIEIEKAKSIEAFLAKVHREPEVFLNGKGKFDALLTLCLASCYAPNLKNKPLYGDLYFDVNTGEINNEIWGKYLSWDPIRLVDQHIEDLKKMCYIRLECGQEDEFSLQLGHRQFANKLKAAQVKYELEEYPGRHAGHSWRFADRIKKMALALF